MPVYIINEELLQLTKNAIESLGDVGLIIVDNGSPMGGGYLRSVSEIYLRSTENKGYAHAVNAGLSLVHNDLVAIANNDIRVSPNWLSVTQEVFREPNVYSCHFRMTNYDEPYQYGSTIAYTGKERWCTSSFFVIKTRDEKGNLRKFFYDEKFGIGGYEDYDYWYQVQNAGFKQAYTDRACYQHMHSATQNILDQNERKLRDEKSRMYFKSKWGEEPDQAFQKRFPDQWKQDYGEGFRI